MKTIEKSPANDSLAKADKNGVTWDEFVDKSHTEYIQVRAQALADQLGECAYTGLWLGDGTKQTIHLDHFRKKSLYPELRFQWHNLFAAAKGLDYGSDFKDRQIHGPLKNSDIQYSQFYSPLTPNLQEMLWYQQDSRVAVHPDVSDEKKPIVENTISMYNLNAPDLVNRRLGIIRMIRACGKLDDKVIRLATETAGFSFVVEFELKYR